MKINPARATRPLFVASMVLFITSLVLSVTNVATVLSAPLRTLSAPDKFGYEGYLADAYGNPVADGQYVLLFKVYATATGGTRIGEQTITTTVTNGYYAVVLGPLSPNDPFAEPYADGSPQWIGVTVNGGTEILPRTQIASVPYALVARSVDWDGITHKPTGVGSGNVVGTGTAGQAAVWTGTNTIAGTNTLTLTGELRASGDVRAQAGLYVGANADPPDNDIIADGGISLGTSSDPGNGTVQLAEISPPTTPGSSALRWYADSAQSWGWFKNDAGKEVPAGLARLPVSIFAMRADSGAPVNFASNWWALSAADGVFTGFEYHFNLPPGWQGRTLTVDILWAPASSTSGNVRWETRVTPVVAGTTVGVGPQALTTSASSAVAARPALATLTTSLSSGNGFAEGCGVILRIARLGADGADTMGATAHLVNVELSIVD